MLRGLPENAPINISMYVRYNATTHKNSYGVGQAASQAIGAAIEWQTDQHQIVGFHLENKLCKVGAMLRSQGQHITCPGHERCSATLPAVDPILEYAIGKQIGHSFAHDDVAIRYVAAPHLKPNRNTFRALTVNFQSIKAKRTSFWMLLSEVNLDIVNETWLHEMVYEREVLPGGCHVIAGRDRKDHHVDVAIIAKDSITGTEINVKTEFPAVLFECRMNNPCIIGALHRPPNTDQSYKEELSFKIREQHSDNPRATIWNAGDANDWEPDVISRNSNPCKLVGAFLITCMA